MSEEYHERGAGSSAPKSRASVGNPGGRGIPISARNFNRVFGGRVPPKRGGKIADHTRLRNVEPRCTLGAPVLRGGVLEGGRFDEWARHRRCGLNYDLLCVLDDDAWDIWRAAQVTKGEKGAHRSLVRLCEGAYQIPRTVFCDRAFTRDPLSADFVAVVDSYLRSPSVVRLQNPVRRYMNWWGTRLPDYSQEGSATLTRRRQWHSFEWALLIEGGYVVTHEDWEVTKGVSSVTAFEGMSVQGLISNGFHLSAADIFPPTPTALRGRGSVPAGLAIPPLWSLRFFAAFVFGGGSPTGSHPPRASTRQRLLEIMEDELAVCVALGVTAERAAYRRTPFLPLELINKVLRYDGPDSVPTTSGPVSIRGVGDRLAKVRTLPTESLVEERPLHVTQALYYAPDELLDKSTPVGSAPSPLLVEAHPRPEALPVMNRGVLGSVPIDSISVSQPRARDEKTSCIEPRLGARLERMSPPEVLPWSVSPVKPLNGNPIARATGAPYVQVPRPSGVAPTPIAELVNQRVDIREFNGAFPWLLGALHPLRGKRKGSLREVLECLSGWVRNNDARSRPASLRGSRGGTTLELRRVSADLAASLQDAEGLRRRLREMTDRVGVLSGRIKAQEESSRRKRPREDYEEPRFFGSPPSDQDSRARRFRRDDSPYDGRDVRREPQGWRRGDRKGDVDADFTG